MNEVKTENTKETLACLIIDDPPLRPKYGCLDYNRLLEEMKTHNFFTEIAFIPYNYRTSNAETVRLLADNPDRFAICVHGCNHSGNEFGGLNYQRLEVLASTAMWRMEEHKRLTGLPYDPVIVFPQGKFSSVAMQALKDQGYFAAFNSTLQAIDREKLQDNEYQRPATKRYYNFPLFLRRYPKDKSLFLQDLDCGRPIIIGEHHSVFRNGYKTVTDLVDWINTLGKIRWTSLLGIAEHYLGNRVPIIRKGAKPSSVGTALNFRVALRRFLREARDNYIETNMLLTKLYKIIRG